VKVAPALLELLLRLLEAFIKQHFSPEETQTLRISDLQQRIAEARLDIDGSK
jgi:hypothetical protein